MTRKPIKFRATWVLVREYNPDPGDYGTDDVNEMRDIDWKNMQDDPELFFQDVAGPNDGSDCILEIIDDGS